MFCIIRGTELNAFAYKTCVLYHLLLLSEMIPGQCYCVTPPEYHFKAIFYFCQTKFFWFNKVHLMVLWH